MRRSREMSREKERRVEGRESKEEERVGMEGERVV